MNPKQNISLVNALIRITCGCTLLALSTSKLSKKRCNYSYLLLALVAGMKIAEGILRFCPIVALYDRKDEIIPSCSKKKEHGEHKEHVHHSHHDSAEKATSKTAAKILEEFNPDKIFDEDDMKKRED